MEREQRKELLKMVDEFRYATDPRPALKTPPAVRAARRLAREWDERISRRNRSFARRVDRLRTKMRQEIYFGTEKSALAVYRKLAALVKK